MKFHQIKTDVVRSTVFEIVEIERFVDVVFSFVVVVALIAHLIDFHFDALIASITVILTVNVLIVLM